MVHEAYATSSWLLYKAAIVDLHTFDVSRTLATTPG